jgi:hypothetical protein
MVGVIHLEGEAVAKLDPWRRAILKRELPDEAFAVRAEVPAASVRGYRSRVQKRTEEARVAGQDPVKTCSRCTLAVFRAEEIELVFGLRRVKPGPRSKTQELKIYAQPQCRCCRRDAAMASQAQKRAAAKAEACS